MSGDPLLTVRNLSKTYDRRLWWGGTQPGLTALHDVGFTLDRGRTLAVVGPSGSGKSTLARCLAGFEKPTKGEIVFAGDPLEIQLIFQQPAASLNPRFTAAEIVEEPLLIQRRGTVVERRARAARSLEQVGLTGADLDKPSRNFSGGEKQRLAIARALVVQPKLIILDESLTGLDPELQGQIAALLRELQGEFSLTYILISHDLGLVSDLASEIAVMERGQFAEYGAVRQVLPEPRHPLTCELVKAAQALGLPTGGV
jgi:ABC-type glutathione transport system ATPase component